MKKFDDFLNEMNEEKLRVWHSAKTESKLRKIVGSADTALQKWKDKHYPHHVNGKNVHFGAMYDVRSELKDAYYDYRHQTNLPGIKEKIKLCIKNFAAFEKESKKATDPVEKRAYSKDLQKIHDSLKEIIKEIK